MLSPPGHSAASLYCAEDARDVVYSDAGTRISNAHSPSASAHSTPADEAAVRRLIDSESHLMPHRDYVRSVPIAARQHSVDWILRVHRHYEFRPVTAFLSVNYLDRFLSSQCLPEGSEWTFQLLSVACLSLAAKMEEAYVPLLIDLQVLDPKFIFEPKTVQRMEVWVMANLDWRLRSVTPFDYLDYFVSSLLASSSRPTPVRRLLSSSSDLILRTISVIDFLGFPPSVIAAAAVLSAATGAVDFPAEFYERVDKETVWRCHHLMVEYLVDTCLRGAQQLAPPSPVGILDTAAIGSCDTRSDIPAALSGSRLGSLVNQQPWQQRLPPRRF